MADLEPAVELLATSTAQMQAASTKDAVQEAVRSGVQEVAQPWHVCFCAMRWLAVLVMVPFDLNVIDSTLTTRPAPGPGGPAEDEGLIAKVIRLAKEHLADQGPGREAAAVLLGRLLTRCVAVRTCGARGA